MLIFTYETDISNEAKKKLEQALTKRTGQDCLVVPVGCNGVYSVPDPKSCPPSKAGTISYDFQDGPYRTMGNVSIPSSLIGEVEELLKKIESQT